MRSGNLDYWKSDVIGNVFFSAGKERPGQPWGNGAGVVSTIFTSPQLHTCTATPLAVAAIATIEADDSTFSNFPGCTRFQMLLSGETELTVAGATTVLSGRFPKHVFPGSVFTTCHVRQHPVVAFNVIAAEDVSTLQVSAASVEDTLTLANIPVHATEPSSSDVNVTFDLLYCVSGRGAVHRSSGGSNGTTYLATVETNDAVTVQYAPEQAQDAVLLFEGMAELIHARIIFALDTAKWC